MQRRSFNINLTPTLFALITMSGISLFDSHLHAQILFAEDCFIGGVTVAGVNKDGGAGLGEKCIVRWEEDYELYRAYVLTYRYGRPEWHSTYINGSEVAWDSGSQAGPEQIEENDASDFYAPHALDVTDIVEIENDTLVLDFPEQTFYEHSPNWAWCGMYVVILYQAPDVTTPICNRLYVTDQKQDLPQWYTFESPNYIGSSPVILSLFTSRMNNGLFDGSKVVLNSNELGNIYGDDLVIPPANGAQGSFFYAGSEFQGLNGDTANSTMDVHDATAVINEYLNDGTENLQMYRLGGGGSNLHTAFTITYTPECPVIEVDIGRKYFYCRGGQAQLNAQSDYDHFEWTPADGLSDPTIANPVCSRDSSGWYQVRMYNDDGCSQTIPVHVEVTDHPRPEEFTVVSSVCPDNTGAILMDNTPGAQPITYQANALENETGVFENLEPGTYQIINTTDHGCTWDTLVTVPLNPIHEAAFSANPETGYTPLDVFFDNESSEISSGYQWLINGQAISTSENLSQQFPDSGTYQIELVAFYQDETCADTASFTLVVVQGLKLIVPNIITPNGDGFNDALIAKIEGANAVSWTVFNRWGNELHTGTFSQPNSELKLWSPEPNQYPSGVYKLIIKANSESGQVEDRVVDVTLKN